ncbi:MAG: cyclic nucleotide-binding/CBS domain-containing protein [Candidatus Hydrothermarchaeaceae archaeon]
MKLVKDVMTKKVKTVAPSATMAEAARLMRANRIGCLVAIDEAKPVGIITERDLVYKIIAEEKSTRASVRDIMTRDIRTVDGQRTIKDAAKIMATHLIRRLPVVERGKLVGIITIDDIMKSEKIGEDTRLYSYT